MTWVCASCAAEAEAKLAACPACGEWSSYWPRVTRPQAFAVTDESVTTAAELWRSSARWRALPEELAAILGRLPEAAHVGMVFGPPGAGKSVFLLRLADALRLGGPVIFDSLEEGASPSLAVKLRRMELRADDILIVVRNDLASLVALARERGASAIMLDSLTWSPLRGEDVARLARETDAAVWFSVHATKDGGFRGPLALAHVADVVLALGPGGRYELQKSRFADLRAGAVPWWIQKEDAR